MHGPTISAMFFSVLFGFILLIVGIYFYSKKQYNNFYIVLGLLFFGSIVAIATISQRAKEGEAILNPKEIDK